MVILLLSFGLGWFACASAAARIADNMDHRRWTFSDQGPSAVGALAQTADGYLWLGTYDSLYHFDGFEFEKFVPASGEPMGMISALLSTSAGLWVGFRAGGARLISTGGVLQPVDSGLPGGVVYGLAEDQQGRIWIAADDGLAMHDGKDWQPVGEGAGFPDSHARAVHVDADGNVWAASEETVYVLPSGASAFIEVGVEGQSISKIVSSASGDIWITDRARGQLLRLKKTGYADVEVEEVPASRAVSIVVDEHGNPWLGTLESGVHSVNAEEPQTNSAYTGRDGLTSDNVLALLFDRDGTLWVGTDEGLDRLRRKSLSHFTLRGGAGSHALAVTEDGSLWIGSGDGVLTGLWGGRQFTFDVDMPITTLLPSEQYGLLIGGYRGIFSFSDEGPVHLAPLPIESPREAAVRAMAVGKDGAIWVSVNRAGLFVWEDQQWRRTEPVSDSERQIMPVAASQDLTGKLWFGYRENLLVSVDGQTVSRWSEQQGLNVGHVTAMLHLPERTWVGGQYGLAYLQDGRFHRLELPAAGPFENIYALIAVPGEKNADDSGMDIWIHSRGGIFRLPAAEIERVIAGGDTLKYSSHDHIGRLPMDPFKVLPVPTAVYTGDGLLWFATGNGVVPVDPYQPAGIAQPPTVTIKELTADGVEVDISSAPVRLSRAPEKLVVTYSAVNLAAPEAMRFQYRLNGHDSEWVDAGRSRQAAFARLRPGDYQFQVRALGDDEHLNLPAESLALSIPQAIYLRPGFLLSTAGVLSGLVFWGSRAYAHREKAVLRSRLEVRFQERERIARELHDTLLQSVHGMMLHFQAVADGLPQRSQARHSVERALDRADQVIAEGRDRITGLRGEMPPTEDLSDALQTLTPAADLPFSATYDVSNVGEPLALRNDVRDAFYQVGREAVCNALRHAQASGVTVTLTYAPSRFQMLIVDDGVGIDPLYQRMHGRPEHGGLRGMYERAERIEAILTVDSNPQSGTQITLSLPGSVAYANTVDSKRTHLGRLG